MEPWLQFATDYTRDWLEFQFKGSQQPGCIFAIVHRDKVIAEHAFDYLDGPIKRVAALDTHTAFSPPLEEYILPNTNKIVEAIRDLAAY